jgi:hypothetical protein
VGAASRRQSGGVAVRSEVGGGAATQSERHAGAVVNFPDGWLRARVVFNSMRGSRRGKFGAR